MAKRSKSIIGDGESMVSETSCTTPSKPTTKQARGLHKSAILDKCAASSFWQYRVFPEGKPRKRSRKAGQSATKTSNHWGVTKRGLVSDKELTVTDKFDDPEPSSGSEKRQAGRKHWNAQK